jgi:hypothetical protein
MISYNLDYLVPIPHIDNHYRLFEKKIWNNYYNIISICSCQAFIFIGLQEHYSGFTWLNVYPTTLPSDNYNKRY